MGIWKKEATHCRRCDVEFDGTNKYKKRAVCKDCQKIEWAERMAKKKVGAVNYHQLYDEIKIEKRKHIHEEINKQLKATTVFTVYSPLRELELRIKELERRVTRLEKPRAKKPRAKIKLRSHPLLA